MTTSQPTILGEPTGNLTYSVPLQTNQKSANVWATTDMLQASGQ